MIYKRDFQMKFVYVVLILLLTFASSCKNSNGKEYSIATPNDNTQQPPQGKKLMEQYCYLCHNPKTDHDSRIAPPMVAIKSHYLEDDMSKEAFGDAIWDFVQKPSKEKSKMRGAVRRFGVMPYQPYQEKDIRAIANYIYEYKIEEPSWFKEHLNEHQGKGKRKMKYRNSGKSLETENALKTNSEKGLQFALATKKELGKNLMGTIQKKGAKEAVEFCHQKAYPITDSMASLQGVSIKRVSDKPRNSNNQANKLELEQIQIFKDVISNGEQPNPIAIQTNNKTTVYYPIVTNTMCIQCHGNPEKDINQDVLSTLNNLYPNDKAMGYNVNEVRGVWAVSWNNDK